MTQHLCSGAGMPNFRYSRAWLPGKAKDCEWCAEKKPPPKAKRLRET